MAKKKKKKNKVPYYIASAMAVLAAASVGLMFYSGGLNPKAEKETTSVVVQQAGDVKSADGFIQKRQPMDYPMMSAGLDNLYVSANPYGMFSFYEVQNGNFVSVEDVQTMDISVTCSHQDIPTKLYYVERDGHVSGYGLFLTSLYEEDVRLYSYAFFRLTDLPASYGTGKMLLVDFDDGEFAKYDKNYTEVFSFDMATGKSQRLTSDNGRTVDNLGRLRTDWAQMNEALQQLGGEQLYLTGRNYQLDSATADIIQNKDTSNAKPKVMSTGVWEKWMHTENGKTYYAKETEDGFEIYSMNASGNEEKVGAYAGSVEDYLFSGDYMLEKNTLALKRISTDENKGKLENDALRKVPNAFSVSPDGKKAMILFDGETQSAMLYDTTTGKCEAVQGKGLFTNSCDQIQWLADGTCMTIAETASGYEAVLWKF